MNEDLFTLFTSRFASAGIDAVVTGSVAAMLYGEPRLTHDIALSYTRSRRTSSGGVTIDIASPEYVIVRKLEFFREGGSAKHLEDIRGIVRQQGEKLDGARAEPA